MSQPRVIERYHLTALYSHGRGEVLDHLFLGIFDYDSLKHNFRGRSQRKGDFATISGTMQTGEPMEKDKPAMTIIQMYDRDRKTFRYELHRLPSGVWTGVWEGQGKKGESICVTSKISIDSHTERMFNRLRKGSPEWGVEKEQTS